MSEQNFPGTSDRKGHELSTCETVLWLKVDSVRIKCSCVKSEDSRPPYSWKLFRFPPIVYVSFTTGKSFSAGQSDNLVASPSIMRSASIVFWIDDRPEIDASQRQFVKLTIVSVIQKLTVNRLEVQE